MAHPVISVDVMGGDHGSDVILSGIEKALVQRSDVRFLLFGNEQIVRPALARRPRVESASTLTHCDMSIAMDAKPSVALRQGRKVSSMWQAITAVKSGEAQACISAGNTGALMASPRSCCAPCQALSVLQLWPSGRLLEAAVLCWMLAPPLAGQPRNMPSLLSWGRLMGGRFLIYQTRQLAC